MKAVRLIYRMDAEAEARPSVAILLLDAGEPLL